MKIIKYLKSKRDLILEIEQRQRTVQFHQDKLGELNQKLDGYEKENTAIKHTNALFDEKLKKRDVELHEANKKIAELQELVRKQTEADLLINALESVGIINNKKEFSEHKLIDDALRESNLFDETVENAIQENRLAYGLRSLLK
jgi:hypothetical protein